MYALAVRCRAGGEGEEISSFFDSAETEIVFGMWCEELPPFPLRGQ
jgi:hypothetical protein